MAKKVLLVIAFHNFRDEEYLEPKKVLEEAGFLTVAAADQRGVASGKLGLKVPVNLILEELNPDDYAAVLFVGGPGAANYYDNPIAHRLARTALEAGKIVGAICGAPPILARAGILQGKKATMFTDNGEIAKGGGTFTGNGVEIDGKIITATGPQTAKEWGEAVVKALL